MSEYHDKRAKEILDTIIYATLATVSENGEPWNSPVRFTKDAELNIYWASDKESQHSKNVRANGQVFIVIYDSTVPEGKGEGVYLRAKAVEISDPDAVLNYMKLKKGDGDYDPNDFLGEAVRRIYKAVPEQAWMNDDEIKDSKFIKDIRVEIQKNKL